MSLTDIFFATVYRCWWSTCRDLPVAKERTLHWSYDVDKFRSFASTGLIVQCEEVAIKTHTNTSHWQLY